MKPTSRNYAMIRRAKSLREQAREAREHALAARRAAIALGVCMICGANRLGGEPHGAACQEDGQ